jgi:hypothetical protein
MPTDRRTFLATAASLAATAGLAGCSGDSGDNKVGGQPTRTQKKERQEQTLSFGETLELPSTSITLSKPRTTDAYQWAKEGEDRVAEAGEGKQWLVVKIRAENTTDRTVRLPLTLNFKGVRGDTVYHPGRNKSKSQKYIGGKAPAGEVREGEITYLTPQDVGIEEFEVLYTEWRPSDKQRVVWQS